MPQPFTDENRPAGEFLERFAMSKDFLDIVMGTDDGSIADKFTPGELEFMTAVLERDGTQAQRMAVQLSQPPVDRIYPPDAVESLPQVGGMIGDRLGGPIGAGAGGFIGEGVRQFAQGDDFSLGDMGTNAAAQAALSGVFKLSRPLMEKSISASRAVRDKLREVRLNPTGGPDILTQTERPTADLMTRFWLRPGRSGINRVADMRARLQPGSDLPVRDYGNLLNRNQGLITGPRARASLESDLAAVEENLISEQAANVGGASFRDIMKNILQPATTVSSSALRTAESAGVGQGVRALLGLDAAREGRDENFRERPWAAPPVAWPQGSPSGAPSVPPAGQARRRQPLP